MISNGHVVGDGTWDLRIFVTNLQTERLIRVKGDTHMGGVMYKLTQDLEILMDWSDHGLWQPSRNRWVNRVKTTLDQYGIQADALLHFTPMHKTLRVQLPDLRAIDMRVDFSVRTFATVVVVCRELGIAHPEELSFSKPLEPGHLKCNYKDYKGGGAAGQQRSSADHTELGTRRNGHGPPPPPPDTNTFIAATNSGPLDRQPPSATTVSSRRGGGASDHMVDGDSKLDVALLADCSSAGTVEAREARRSLLKPRTLLEKARMNVAWLDSSLSIMEQGVKEYDTLCLRFKFYVFYDLNPKTDAVRINQIYEQAKWQLLNEEIDCTEEEMLMFAALQLQVHTQVINHPSQRSNKCAIGNGTNNIHATVNEDDIDAALTDLQTALEGSSLSVGGGGTMASSGSCGGGVYHRGDITKEPELYDHLRFLKPKRFTLRAYKKYWISYRDLHLHLYKTHEAMFAALSPTTPPPLHRVSLRGCEVTPDVNIAQGRYGIRLDVPGADGMTEMYIRCDNEKQYAVWMAACRLASKGRSLADSSYDMEIQAISDLLELQKPSKNSFGSTTSTPISASQISAENYLSPRYARKLKGKAEQRILESHTNVRHLHPTDAKLKYIAAWQSLPDYGVSLFVVRFSQSKRDELLGVAHNRIMKLDINTGDNMKTWRFNTLKAWNVNWEVKLMMTQFEEENLMFHVLSADCKRSHLSEETGMEVFLKKDFLQYTGSFKERGARCTMLMMDEAARRLGVISASLGNHAQAMSWHGHKLGIPTTVVMPIVAPIMKIQKCRAYKANVIVQGKDMAEAKNIALRLAKKNGWTYINGYDHPHVIAGQGTMGLEIVEQVDNIDAVIVPTGGGGLIAGVGLAIKSLQPNVQIIGVESENCASFSTSLRAGRPTLVPSESTLADGLAVPLVGSNALHTARPYVDKMVTVSEKHIAVAILKMIELEKCVVEGAGAAGLAAILSGQLAELRGKRVVLILTGGNIDTTILGRCLERGLAAEGRMLKVKVTVSDRPGGIAELCKIIASIGVSIKDILHERAWVSSDVFSVEAKVVCETRDYQHSLQLQELLRKNYKYVSGLSENDL